MPGTVVGPPPCPPIMNIIIATGQVSDQCPQNCRPDMPNTFARRAIAPTVKAYHSMWLPFIIIVSIVCLQKVRS